MRIGLKIIGGVEERASFNEKVMFEEPKRTKNWLFHQLRFYTIFN